jgi:tetratricopeptide (TPR) repeat protein
MAGFPGSDPFAPLESTFMTNGDVSGEVGRMVDNEACNTWTESGVSSPTVSAKRLAVPGKANSEYQRGCSAFKGKKFPEAENHLRRAIEAYSEYPAAWVMLGQALNSQAKTDEARAACWRARELDPAYVAPYLCLAEFAVGDNDWKTVADLANRAFSIDPIGNPYAFFYAANADLHLHQLPQAEGYAQAALKLDTWHHMPEIHLLLAQIYDANGNAQGEASQLREFIKAAPNSKDTAAAKTLLSQVDARPAK